MTPEERVIRTERRELLIKLMDTFYPNGDFDIYTYSELLFLIRKVLMEEKTRVKEEG